MLQLVRVKSDQEMQDIHSIGGGGRLFGGGGSGDRRLRPHHHQNHQALKCPRCDSLNTKFCYYNNYNLSQPRHFCKSCRRYWTKGGVLRNVPVGGGCRKTKRSKPKQQNNASSSSPSTTTNTTTTATDPSTPTTTTTTAPAQEVLKSSNSHSSSESSSLTAANTTTTNANNTAMEEVSGLSSSNNNNILSGMINPSFETGLLEQAGPSSDCGIFSEIGSFTSLITSSNELSFGFGSVLNQQGQLEQVHGHNHHHQQQWQPHQQQQPQKMVGLGGDGEDMAGGLMDQAVQVELSALQSNNRSGSNGGFGGGLDNWHGTGGGDHQGLFDLPNTVDQAYWSQSQWTDQDHPSLYLP
ncbi:hypothetical protein Tsubulata_045295 [Turnera subulata]|uniref:Dof zinc finger protein n=1 Tax=Turnera subulata TaxID=218843 RepID=A0A9Q0FI89_9ROSI|nr:hypothetical protein Tsubulata_045295 [Turnera subulata]